MKLFIVILATLFGVSLQTEQEYAAAVNINKKLVEDFLPGCVSSTGVDQSLVTDLIEHGIFHYGDDRNFMCLCHCIQLHLGMIDENDQFSKEGFQKVLSVIVADQSLGDRVVQKCSDATGKDGCEKSYLSDKCMYDTVREALP